MGARIAACALTLGLGLAGLGGPLAVAADETNTDDTNGAENSVVVETPAPQSTAPEFFVDQGRTEGTTTDETESATATPPVVADDAAVAPLSVPVAPAGSAVISVNVGGDRLPDGSVQGLAGVTLGLYGPGTASSAGPSSTALPLQGAAGTRYNAAWSWTTCVSDADGDCNFVVPIRAGAASVTGAPQDTRFWVVQESAPAGWYANPTMRVGGFGASPNSTWQYRFRTDTQLRAGSVYRSTTAMPAGATYYPPDRGFMRNRPDDQLEGGQSENVTRTTGIWSESRMNPALPAADCELDVALVVDTSGSLGAPGIASMKSTLSAFVDAFQGTQTRMSLFSFSSTSPGSGATNNPALLPVTTPTQGAAFKAQYASWLSGGGTNWDRGLAAAANAAARYDVTILLTDGNPTVIADPAAGSSAFNSLQDVDAGIFTANQLKAEGTRVLALGIGAALTPESDYNLRAVSGTSNGTDYLRVSSFAEATAALKSLVATDCQGTIGVQKMIVPAGGGIADATPAPAGWQFDATTVAPTAVTINAPATQVTTAGGSGKVDFGLTFAAEATSGGVRILETQQAGYQIVPVGAGVAARNAVCIDTATGTPVSVTDAGTAAQPGFTVAGLKAHRIECTVYNRAAAPGALTVAKSSDPASGTVVAPGQSVTYTLTFANTGGTPITVDREDILTGVLDDADLQGVITAGAPLTATRTGDRIRITGTLQSGAQGTVSYTVRVKDPLPAAGDASLGNFVVTTGQQPPETCEPGQPCTVHPVRVGLTWSKVDVGGNLLSGSDWLLTPYDSTGALDSGRAVPVLDCVADSTAVCTGADRDPDPGEFALAGLEPGRYRLAETKAPAGYQLLQNPIDIVVNTDVAYGDIENEQIGIPGIPLTGGTGSLMFGGIAGGLGVLVVLGLWWQRRRIGEAGTA
ncbi:SpaA isopeptide-forming pilin-related protein [Microbacterium sp. NPDC055988]|uniref:DUF7927 domain-containing protein n=1 Tax=Microbacterium sp. NPDC055988 TaxID=3345671 RepID=UPI0035E0DAE3